MYHSMHGGGRPHYILLNVDQDHYIRCGIIDDVHEMADIRLPGVVRLISILIVLVLMALELTQPPILAWSAQ